VDVREWRCEETCVDVTLVEVEIEVESRETEVGVPVLVKWVCVDPPELRLTGDTPAERVPIGVVDDLMIVISRSPLSIGFGAVAGVGTAVDCPEDAKEIGSRWFRPPPLLRFVRGADSTPSHC